MNEFFKQSTSSISAFTGTALLMILWGLIICVIIFFTGKAVALVVFAKTKAKKDKEARESLQRFDDMVNEEIIAQKQENHS